MSIWQDKPLIQKWIADACEANKVPELVPKIKWRFSNRFRTRMGDANSLTNMLRFSAILWNRATPEQKQNTVKHEACHLITWHLYGKVESHGKEWASTMRYAGQKPDRCHSVQTAKKTIDVICSGCKQVIKMGLIRARKMKRGERNYRCRKCNSVVEFIK